ncbi:MAG: FG-GAP repeat protein [Planctomycetia bacterium]|nr:FG-GAP repeat protein [Planctomycetia bacterium]
MHYDNRPQRGFSLIQMSALIAVGGIIMVSVLPGGSGSTDLERADITLQRMHAIETAMQGFMAAHHRRPCPAGISDLMGSAVFGMEQLESGHCASAVGASEYAGMPPVRTLGLPEEHAFDGWGRRMQYRVDQRTTVSGASALSADVSSCFDLQSQRAKGAIEIASAHDAAVSGDNVMWALISHGKDKYGSYSMQGQGPLDGATDDDTLKNIALEGRLVRRDPSDGFDDIVWYREQTKNTCCQGKACALGFTAALEMDGTPDTDAGAAVAVGDINGDGIQDLVIGNGAAGTARVIVAFGSRTGWPVRDALDLNAVTGGDGSLGFVVSNDSSIIGFGKTVATGDVNGDAYDDIVIGGYPSAIVFGKGSFADGTTLTSALDGTAGLLVNYGLTIAPGATAVADMDGDGIKDIVFAQHLNPLTQYLFFVWGRSSANWCSLVTACDGASLPKTWTTAHNTIGIADGFSLSATSLSNAAAVGNFSLAAGDVNGDGIDDLLIGGNSGGAGAGAYLLFGKSRATWTTPGDWTWSATNTKGLGPVINANNPAWGVKFVSNAAASNYLTIGNSVAVADLNNDGFRDLIVSDVDRIYFYYGRAAGSWPTGTVAAPYDIYTNASTIIDTATNRPSWISSPVPSVVSIADINDDGRMDLLIGVKNSGSPSGCLGDPGTTTGSIYIVLQPAGGWSSANLFSGVANTACDANELNTVALPGSFRISGTAAYDYAFRPAAADINADGRIDVLIVAPGNVTDRGGFLYVLLGRRQVPWEAAVELNKLLP